MALGPWALCTPKLANISSSLSKGWLYNPLAAWVEAHPTHQPACGLTAPLFSIFNFFLSHVIGTSSISSSLQAEGLSVIRLWVTQSLAVYCFRWFHFKTRSSGDWYFYIIHQKALHSLKEKESNGTYTLKRETFKRV